MFHVKRPFKGTYPITSRFGWRWLPKKGFHSGIDYGCPVGTPILAAYKGEMVFAGKRGNYGECVILKHPSIGNVWTLYAHLESYQAPGLFVPEKLNSGQIKPFEGHFINQGEVIAYSGSTGWSTGFHLHFECRLNFNGILFAKNPELYLEG